MIAPGKYRHFKGGLYEVIDTALHSETQEQLVVYRSLDHGTLWVRPAEMFFDHIDRDGYEGPRFIKVILGTGDLPKSVVHHCRATEPCCDDVYCNCHCDACEQQICFRPGCNCGREHG